MTAAKPKNIALHESEDHFRTLFHLNPIAVYSCNTAGVIQDFNDCAAALWGRSPAKGDTDEQFCGSYKLFLPDGTYMPHAECPMAQVIDGKIAQVRNAEVIIERPDSSRITVIVNILPLKNQYGKVTGAINCFYDITERKQMETALRQQSAALADLHHRKDEFLAILSHELRNPLAPIQYAVRILRTQIDQSPLQQQARQIIERQLGQLTRLIDELMDVTHLVTKGIQLRVDRIVVNEIVERAVETAAPAIAQREHELKISLSREPIWLNADGSRLEQVLVNLLLNAAKYTDRGGHVWLSVKGEGDECVLSVRDSGIGIASDLLPRVFDLFTQADGERDRADGGLGIGLAIAKRIVEMHGGRISVHSALGHGSEFMIHLPVATSGNLSAQG